MRPNSAPATPVEAHAHAVRQVVAAQVARHAGVDDDARSAHRTRPQIEFDLDRGIAHRRPLGVEIDATAGQRVDARGFAAPGLDHVGGNVERRAHLGARELLRVEAGERAVHLEAQPRVVDRFPEREAQSGRAQFGERFVARTRADDDVRQASRGARAARLSSAPPRWATGEIRRNQRRRDLMAVLLDDREGLLGRLRAHRAVPHLANAMGERCARRVAAVDDENGGFDRHELHLLQCFASVERRAGVRRGRPRASARKTGSRGCGR